MATLTKPVENQTVEKKIQKLRELYADAPEVGKIALEKGLADLGREMAAPARSQTAGRLQI